MALALAFYHGYYIRVKRVGSLLVIGVDESYRFTVSRAKMAVAICLFQFTPFWVGMEYEVT